MPYSEESPALAVGGCQEPNATEDDGYRKVEARITEATPDEAKPFMERVLAKLRKR